MHVLKLRRRLRLNVRHCVTWIDHLRAGPLISSSATRLVMVCTSENREAKKRIRLVNDSKATAIFMFDVDLLRRPFEANPKHGHIKPCSRKCVTITFAPREDGIYTCHFPCLILNHVMSKF